MDARSSLVTPPVEFGGYTLKGELGHGASGRVFECKKKDCATLYAVKVLHLRSLRLRQTAQRDLTRLGRELKILKELPPHPRIVQMVDSFEEGDWFFLVLELVRGGDLFRALMDRRPTKLFEREAAFVFWQLVDGISFLHSRNIIHRDLKLENVLISDKHREGKLTMYNVKISDFGLSKAVTGGPEMMSVVGTQRYVAPEVLTAQRPEVSSYDFRVDLWSLGVLTFILLTGGYPSPESQPALNEAVSKISSEPARLILKGLLQLDPVQRFTLQDLQSRSWQTGDEDVIMLPPALGAVPAPSAVGIPSDSTVCSDFEVAPPAPLNSLNDPSLVSGLPEAEMQRMPSLLPTMSFLAGMEEELKRPPRPPPVPAPAATAAPAVSEQQLQNLTGELSDMQDHPVSKANTSRADVGVSKRPIESSFSWQLSHTRAANARPDEMHLHVLVPSRGDRSEPLVDEETVKALNAKSGCNVWTSPPEGPRDSTHVVMVGTCSQCTVAQQMLADFLSKRPTESFTVMMFYRSDVELDQFEDLQQRSHCAVELLPKEQEGKRPWVLTGTLVQVLEAERLIHAGPPALPKAKRKRKSKASEVQSGSVSKSGAESVRS